MSLKNITLTDKWSQREYGTKAHLSTGNLAKGKLARAGALRHSGVGPWSSEGCGETDQHSRPLIYFSDREVVAMMGVGHGRSNR